MSCGNDIHRCCVDACIGLGGYTTGWMIHEAPVHLFQDIDGSHEYAHIAYRIVANSYNFY